MPNIATIFPVNGLRNHRVNLGLSAPYLGRLVGVTGTTIYRWETGRTKPDEGYMAKLAAVCKLSKQQVEKKLAVLGATRDRSKRGVYLQTSAAFVLSLVRNRKTMTTSQVVAAWKRAGRGGKVTSTLIQLVRRRQIKRARIKGVKGERGSSYRVG